MSSKLSEKLILLIKIRKEGDIANAVKVIKNVLIKSEVDMKDVLFRFRNVDGELETTTYMRSDPSAPKYWPVDFTKEEN